MLSTVASISMLAAVAMAAPGAEPIPTAVANRMKLHLGTAHGGALDFPQPTAPPKLFNGKVAGPDLFTVQMIFDHDTPITTIHVEGAGSADPVGGKIAPGNVKSIDYQQIVVPRDYYGNIAFNVAGFPADTGDESLIEFSFRNQNGIYTPDIDVSFVNGFSMPISCACFKQSGEKHFSGCSKDLYALNSCPGDKGQHACPNPRRFDENNRTPTAFFAPCHRYGGAYTYPDDNDDNTLNGDRCIEGVATCCIGNACSSWDNEPR